MTSKERLLLDRRESKFDEFYKELIPNLAEFVGRVGIQPAREVSNYAVEYVPHLEIALRDMIIENEHDRVWLLTRMGYFVGEYFVQKYDGCWFVNDDTASPHFARYVVGRFSKFEDCINVVDPFEIAQAYVGMDTPRRLGALLVQAEFALAGGGIKRSRHQQPVHDPNS